MLPSTWSLLAPVTTLNPSRHLKLLLVTHYFPAHRGGVEIVAFELAQRLASRLELHWMAADCDPPPELPTAQLDGQPAWNGFEHYFKLPWPVWRAPCWRRLNDAIRHADVVHIHDFIYPSSIAAFLLAKLAGKPLLITQHIGDVEYQSIVLKRVLRTINRSLGRLMLSHANQVVFISPKVYQLFNAFTRFSQPPAYWPNGVDGQIFRPPSPTERRQIRKRLGVEDQDRVILFVGRFVEKKGLPLLRKLVEEPTEWLWWFAGWGQQGALHPDKWPYPNTKTWTDRSGTTLAELYQAADVLILPSYGEGFPLVIQESLACGTPVITSADTAMGGPTEPDIILSIPHNPAAPCLSDWMNALTRLLDAPATSREALRNKASAFAHAEWNWDHVAENYFECIVELGRSKFSQHSA